MLTFKISNGQEFKMPESQDLTLGRYQEWHELHKKLIEELSKRLSLPKNEELSNEILDNVTNAEILTLYPDFFKRSVSFWSGLTKKQIGEIEPEYVLSIFNRIFDELQPPEGKEIKDFKLGKNTYVLPENLTGIDGQVVPMGKNTFDKWAAKQTSKGDGIDSIHKEISILVHDDLQEGLDDADKFKDLKMDTVWQIAFFLTKRNLISLKTTLNSLDRSVVN